MYVLIVIKANDASFALTVGNTSESSSGVLVASSSTFSARSWATVNLFVRLEANFVFISIVQHRLNVDPGCEELWSLSEENAVRVLDIRYGSLILSGGQYWLAVLCGDRSYIAVSKAVAESLRGDILPSIYCQINSPSKTDVSGLVRLFHTRLISQESNCEAHCPSNQCFLELLQPL